MIPYGRQDISEEDIAAVLEVLHSRNLTQGPAIPGFEEAVAEAAGAPHAVALANATAGLHLACLALDLGPGDRLWTVPNSFLASANCGRYCGAEVDFVDIHPRTFDMDPLALAAKLERARDRAELPSIVVPVHFGGRPCPLKKIAELGQEFGFKILEDASHAIGAKFKGDSAVGCCAHSSASVFSFHPVKLVTSGEGGVVTTQDPELAAKIRLLREHGVSRDSVTAKREGAWYYEQSLLGFNYRLTDLQAALGRSQMTRLESFVSQRNQLADRYRRELADLPLVLPLPTESGRSADHLFVVRVPKKAGVTRRELFDALRERGIGVHVHYIPIHLQPYYRSLGFSPGDFPQAEAYYREALSIPLFHGMSEAEQDRVIGALSELLG